MKTNQGKFVKFDEKTIKEKLTLEDRYILNIRRKTPILDTTEIQMDEEISTDQSIPVRTFGSSSPAKSLEELKERVREMKGSFKNGKHNKKNKNSIKGRVEKRMVLKDSVVKKLSNTETSKTKSVSFKPSKPVFNSQGCMVFNKFDFSGTDTKQTNKKTRDEKDPRKLLRKLQKHNEKLKRLEEEGKAEEVRAIKEKQAWETALKRSEGIKVKDDPKRLLNTIKKKLQQKRKSQREWKERNKQVEQQKEARQQKRKANIQERLKQKNKKKMKKLIKRGRMIPGYT